MSRSRVAGSSEDPPGMKSDVAGGGPDHQAEAPRFGDPAAIEAVEGEVGGGERERDLPRLAGGEGELGEAAELDHRTAQRGDLVPDVELDHLVPGAGAAVRDAGAHSERKCSLCASARDPKVRILEGGVAQSEAERKERLAGAIEVVIAAAGG